MRSIRPAPGCVLAVVALLLFAACDDGRPGPTARPGAGSSVAASASSPASPGPPAPSSASASAPASSSAPELGPAAAERLLSDAVARFRSADSGRYRTSSVYGDESIANEGRFELSSRSQESRVTLGDDEQRVQVSSVSLGAHGWVRLDVVPDQPAQRCWTSVTPTQARYAGRYLAGAAVLGVPPPAAVVLSLREPTDASVERVRAEADLFAVAASTLAALPLALEVEEGDGTVPITVFLHDGVITGWSVDVATVLRAAPEAGGVVPPQWEGLLDDPDVALVRIGFYDPGRPVDLAPPPREQVVAVPPTDPGYARAAEDCEGGAAT